MKSLKVLTALSMVFCLAMRAGEATDPVKEVEPEVKKNNVPTVPPPGVDAFDHQRVAGGLDAAERAGSGERAGDAVQHGAAILLRGRRHDLEAQIGMLKLGMEPAAMSPIAFREILRQDLEHWGPIVKASGFTAED